MPGARLSETGAADCPARVYRTSAVGAGLGYGALAADASPVSGGGREQDDPSRDKRPAGYNPKGYLLDMTGRYELGTKKGERDSYGDHPQEHPQKEKDCSQGSLADSSPLSPRGHPGLPDKARSAVGGFARVGITKPRFGGCGLMGVLHA
jgi:hypothetical protein